MQNKIGIGIVTFNRPKELKNLIGDIRQYTTLPYDLFVADDGSPDELVSWLISQKIPYKSGTNRGIGHNKNKIFYHFKNSDYIFIIEDDIRIKKKGWEELFIEGIEKSGENHLSWYDTKNYSGRLVTHSFHNICLEELGIAGAAVQVFSRKCLEIVGGFDLRFCSYGHEHTQLTERIYEVKLNKFKYAKVKNGDEYFEDLGITTAVKSSQPNLKNFGEINHLTHINIRYFQNKRLESYYFPFIPVEDNLIECSVENGICMFIYPHQIEQGIQLLTCIIETTSVVIYCGIAYPNFEIEQFFIKNKINYLITKTFWATYNKNILLSKLQRMLNIVWIEPDLEIINPNWLNYAFDLHNSRSAYFSIFPKIDSNGKVSPLIIKYNDNHNNYMGYFEVPRIPLMIFSRKVLETLGCFCMRLYGYGMENLEYFVRASILNLPKGIVPADILKNFFSNYIFIKGDSYIDTPLEDVHIRDYKTLLHQIKYIKSGIIPIYQPLWNPTEMNLIKNLQIIEHGMTT